MNSRKRSGSGVFLMEMIMVCGFFLLCAAICIRVFIQADSMSRLARETNQAVLAAESLAENWKVNGWESVSQDNPDEGKAEKGKKEPVITVSFDQNWNQIPSQEADRGCWFAAALSGRQEVLEDGSRMEVITVQVMRGADHPYRKEMESGQTTEPLYVLEAKRYVPAGNRLPSAGGENGKK